MIMMSYLKHFTRTLQSMLDGQEGMVTVIIEEYQYHSNFRIDKEINIMACIAKIIQML
jgi:hypothetical protein